MTTEAMRVRSAWVRDPTGGSLFSGTRSDNVPNWLLLKNCASISRLREQAILNVISSLHHGRLRQCIGKLPLERNHPRIETIARVLGMTYDVTLQAASKRLCGKWHACLSLWCHAETRGCWMCGTSWNVRCFMTRFRCFPMFSRLSYLACVMGASRSHVSCVASKRCIEDMAPSRTQPPHMYSWPCKTATMAQARSVDIRCNGSQKPASGTNRSTEASPSLPQTKSLSATTAVAKPCLA